jgi:hypothetical protein
MRKYTIAFLLAILLACAGLASAGNNKPIGIAYADPELESATISGNVSIGGNLTVTGTTSATGSAGALKATSLSIGTAGAEVAITATPTELNYNDITTLGTGAASKSVVLDSGEDYTWPATGILTYGVLKDPAGTTLGATVAELNQAADLSTQTMTPGVGISAGVGTVYKTSIIKQGDIIKTTIFLDLTGLASSTTDTDIIGTAGVSHLGQITAAKNGTLFFGQVTCLETPATGADDVIFYSATEGTGAFDGLVTDLTETVLYDKISAAAGAAATQIAFAALPAANSYLYLANGEGSVVGTYTAGQFKIEFWGF